MRAAKRGTIVVEMHDGSKHIVEADKKLIDSSGDLVLYKFLRIGAYACPLKVEEVERFAAGSWAKVRSTFEPSQETLDKGTQDENK